MTATSPTARRRVVVVLDDDPTGSQTVHGVEVVTTLEPEEIRSALSGGAPAVFLLTNTRSLPERDAAELSRTVGRAVLDIARDLEVDVVLVSRSDSTLRGHVISEPTVLRALLGGAVVVFAPAYFEAGRFTEGDVQWVATGDSRQPVATTEFARDATFGYSSSNLADFLIERSGGEVRSDAIVSITAADIAAGAYAVANRVNAAPPDGWVIVNATDYDDYDTVVTGLRGVDRPIVYRTGPSFVRSLAGIPAAEPLTANDIWPAGPPAAPRHGLVVVGSHVGRTTRQLDALRERIAVEVVELDVDDVLSDGDAAIARSVERVASALGSGSVVLATSRERRTGADGDDSLRIARAVSAAVSATVAAVLPNGPAWVVAKGGITSHDVAVDGLGIRRARVLGQLGRGIISVFDPIDASPAAVGLPYVVFAGNVGTDDTLSDVVATLTGPP